MGKEEAEAMYGWMQKMYLQEFPETEVFDSRYWKEYIKPHVLMNEELGKSEMGQMMTAGMMSCYIVGFLLGEGYEYDIVCSSGERFSNELERLKQQIGIKD